MFVAFVPRAARFGLAAAGALALLGLSGSSTRLQAADQGWPARVNASYKVEFNGFDIGRFSFEAAVRGGQYSAGSKVELSALLGAFKWQGLTRSSGAVSTTTAEPAAYTFDYQSNSKSGAIKLAFRDGKVTSIGASPPTLPSDDLVPLEKKHLSNVLDPLSAVLALTRQTSGDPCSQRLPVFDGKQRFDLVVTPLGRRQLVSRQSSGQPEIAHVCQMQYRPIAGYKRGKETEDLARTMKIEVVLRPVPGANILVPQEIKIPTLVGSASLSLERIDILTANSDQIALAN
ncbi:MAG: DUF3108 domain-containing protein [Hyphomicrobiaceae bacterium]|nr:DUF3108 domain-containing protein [Hyphomicrobiaceae bacterium]